MVNLVRFGRKLKIPSTVQIKHELLLLWLKDQTEKEAAEACKHDGGISSLVMNRNATGQPRGPHNLPGATGLHVLG
jgi:hypothetical protein